MEIWNDGILTPGKSLLMQTALTRFSLSIMVFWFVLNHLWLTSEAAALLVDLRVYTKKKTLEAVDQIIDHI